MVTTSEYKAFGMQIDHFTFDYLANSRIYPFLVLYCTKISQIKQRYTQIDHCTFN